jgi:hypothetical protein
MCVCVRVCVCVHASSVCVCQCVCVCVCLCVCVEHLEIRAEEVGHDHPAPIGQVSSSCEFAHAGIHKRHAGAALLPQLQPPTSLLLMCVCVCVCVC